jgi:hypothetical protein
MPRRIKHPQAQDRVSKIVQERRANEAVAEALALERIDQILGSLPEPEPGTR